MASSSNRVWKKVRHPEDDPPKEGGVDDMRGVEDGQPFSFRYAVFGSRLGSPNLEDE